MNLFLLETSLHIQTSMFKQSGYSNGKCYSNLKRLNKAFTDVIIFGDLLFGLIGSYHFLVRNGAVIAAEKKQKSILYDEKTVSKVCVLIMVTIRFLLFPI